MATQHKRTILAVDDDDINLMIIAKNVQDMGYAVESFTSGDEAWDFLLHNPETIDFALLDKMMPGMSGLELMQRMKNHELLKHIPIIIQTGDRGAEQMREGLEKGAYYYLTKPFHPEVLAALMQAVEHECVMHTMLKNQLNAENARLFGLMQHGEFELRNHSEARLLGAALGNISTAPKATAVGITELLYNAIEHGNLEIGYEKKRQLLLSGKWEEELTNFANSDAYSDRVVRVTAERSDGQLHVIIRDEGPGFDWQSYLSRDDGQAVGQGLTKASVMLDHLEFHNNGGEVRCTVRTPECFATIPVISMIEVGEQTN